MLHGLDLVCFGARFIAASAVDQAGYVLVTVLLMLDQGHAAATVAQALGVDGSSVYRYAQTYQLQGLAGYLRAVQPGYWDLLTSTQRRYEKVLAAHPDGPVYVICDNARYYQNKVLNAWLVDKTLVQVFCRLTHPI